MQVQKTGRIRQKRNSHELNGVPEEKDSEEKSTEETPSLPVQVSKPSLAKRISGNNLPLPRSPSRPLSSELSHGDVARQFSMSSSGYESSPTGSLTSLVSDVFPEDVSPRGMKKCATLPQFDHIQAQILTTQNSPEIPRSRSVTSMAQYKKELELSLNGVQSRVRKPSSGRSSPVPTQRKISASNRLSPLATSPSRSREFGAVSPQKLLSPRDPMSMIDDDNYQSSGSDYKNGDQIESRMYKVIYTYIAQEDGEVSLIEGDDVEVIQASENGWWLVRTSEELGWGPSNFLQVMTC